MAGIISKRLLPLPSGHRTRQYSLHRFSSSSDHESPVDVPDAEPKPGSEPKPGNQSKSSFSSYFNEVKANLRREPPPQNRIPTQKPLPFSNRTPPQAPPPSKVASIEEIRRNLSDFRLRVAPPPPSSSSSGQYVSLKELYQRNVMPGDAATSSGSSAGKPPAGPSFDVIRESINQLRSASSAKNQNYSRAKPVDPLSISYFKETLKLKPDQNDNLDPQTNTVGSDGLPSSIFGKELKRSEDNAGSSSTTRMRTELLRLYDFPELGAKLKMLRPEKKKGKWFSLNELNERLAKLRNIEEKESRATTGGFLLKDLKDTIANIKFVNEEAKRTKVRRLDLLGSLGKTPSYMTSPPKDHLVEKYFHPDNMSSSEKLKLELTRVRDEFKMSESDCGSARVQVAQLTTKIKHLSNVLLKKDKHSRRGLQLMVQRRKKLLKYLRRTDWDSYSLLLSKLGLRDNPDIKA